MTVSSFPPWLAQVEAKSGHQTSNHQSQDHAFHLWLAQVEANLPAENEHRHQTERPPRQARRRAAAETGRRSGDQTWLPSTQGLIVRHKCPRNRDFDVIPARNRCRQNACGWVVSLSERDGVDEFLRPRDVSDENNVIAKKWKIACVARARSCGGFGSHVKEEPVSDTLGVGGLKLIGTNCMRRRVSTIPSSIGRPTRLVVFSSGSRVVFFKQGR